MKIATLLTIRHENSKRKWDMRRFGNCWRQSRIFSFLHSNSEIKQYKVDFFCVFYRFSKMNSFFPLVFFFSSVAQFRKWNLFIEYDPRCHVKFEIVDIFSKKRWLSDPDYEIWLVRAFWFHFFKFISVVICQFFNIFCYSWCMGYIITTLATVDLRMAIYRG